MENGFRATTGSRFLAVCLKNIFCMEHSLKTGDDVSFPADS